MARLAATAAFAVLVGTAAADNTTCNNGDFESDNSALLQTAGVKSAQATTCATLGNSCGLGHDGMAPTLCCGGMECQQLMGGQVCGWPSTCAAPGTPCHGSVNGMPPLNCCGDSVCTQLMGGQVCQYPSSCAAPGTSCYLGTNGMAPHLCCDGYDCLQIPGGKVCASNGGSIGATVGR